MNAGTTWNKKRDREGRSRTACVESYRVAERRRGRRPRLRVFAGINWCARKASAAKARSGCPSGLMQTHGSGAQDPAGASLLALRIDARPSLPTTIGYGEWGSRTFRAKDGVGQAQNRFWQGSAVCVLAAIAKATNPLFDNDFHNRTARNCAKGTTTPFRTTTYIRNIRS